ncbi:MAG: host attachment protein [Gammaproteobacteria bacterium]|nr:MAG: host attachment protein [Gammaproteobacteria bacterium]
MNANGYCVVTVDGTRARFFSLEPVEHPELESGPNLVEGTLDLVSTEPDIPGKEMWTDPKTGRHQAPGGGPAHGYDDHRDEHVDEYKRRFARQVAQQALRWAQSRQAKVLVIAAEPKMLGMVREALQVPPHEGIEVREMPKDVSKLSPLQIHERLAEAGLLPPRRKVNPGAPR